MSRPVKTKTRFRLRLVIEPFEDGKGVDAYPESTGYDMNNSKPWPLGTYDSEADAIAARNWMVTR